MNYLRVPRVALLLAILLAVFAAVPQLNAQEGSNGPMIQDNPGPAIPKSPAPESDEPVGLSCRVYRRRDGQISPVPDREDVRAALRRALRHEAA